MLRLSVTKPNSRTSSTANGSISPPSADRAQRLDGRGESDPAILAAIHQRLDAQPVAHHGELALGVVPEGKGEHAAQLRRPGRRYPTPGSRATGPRCRCASGNGGLALLKFGADLPEVVDAAVEDECRSGHRRRAWADGRPSSDRGSTAADVPAQHRSRWPDLQSPGPGAADSRSSSGRLPVSILVCRVRLRPLFRT